MAKKARTRSAARPPDPPRRGIADTRRTHALCWMEARGFTGSFERSGIDFLAFELGLPKNFVAGVLSGDAHLGVQAALAMRRAIAKTPTVNVFDYKVFTEAAIEMTEGAAADAGRPNDSSTKETAVITTEELEPGVDETGRPCIVLLLADGKRASVILPAGTVVEDKPTVLFGKDCDTGSITLLLVRKSEPESESQDNASS